MRFIKDFPLAHGFRRILVAAAIVSLAVSTGLAASHSVEAQAATAQRTTTLLDASTQAQALDKLLASARPGTALKLPNCAQPPSNVDHAMLTDAQLTEYGLPSRSAFASTVVFEKTVRGMKHRDCDVVIGTASQRFGESYINSSNWGGYYEYAGNWSASSVYFTMPSITSCSPSTPGRDGMWGGIGGVNNGNLVQSGTVGWCDDPNAQYNYLEYYQAWIENLGASNPYPVFATDWAPTPGDNMQSLVDDNGTCGYMDIYDAGPGPFAGYYLAETYGPCAQQNYFDCIEENDNYGLAPDGIATFSLCEGYDVPQSKYLVMGNSGSNYTDVTMYDGSRAYASTHSPPNANGKGNFTVTWKYRT